jgi:hypothetical protein
MREHPFGAAWTAVFPLASSKVAGNGKSAPVLAISAIGLSVAWVLALGHQGLVRA